jgi:hypothetical protein
MFIALMLICFGPRHWTEALYRFQLGGLVLLHSFNYVPLLFNHFQPLNNSTSQLLNPSTSVQFILKQY